MSITNPDWWYKRRTCAGMNHYLITRRERRISRDGAFDEPIGRKKIGILAHCCTAAANRVSPRCSRRRLSTTDDNKSLPGAFPSHDVLRDARHAGRARIINYFLPDAYKREHHASAYPRVLAAYVARREVDECNWVLSAFRNENEREEQGRKKKGIERHDDRKREISRAGRWEINTLRCYYTFVRQSRSHLVRTNSRLPAKNHRPTRASTTNRSDRLVSQTLPAFREICLRFSHPPRIRLDLSRGLIESLGKRNVVTQYYEEKKRKKRLFDNCNYEIERIYIFLECTRMIAFIARSTFVIYAIPLFYDAHRYINSEQKVIILKYQ